MNEQRRLTAIMIAVAVIVLLAFAAATVNLIVQRLSRAAAAILPRA